VVHEQAEFIATNMDAVTHLTDAQEWAGAGSMVGAIRGESGLLKGHLGWSYGVFWRVGICLHGVADPGVPNLFQGVRARSRRWWGSRRL
jgi:hypothetical protein